jgi:hypothetical protein
MLRSKFIIALVFSGSVALSAQIGGSTVFNSLELPMSARMAALGGKSSGINDGDLNLAIWNPALLRQDMSTQLSFSFVDYFTDIRYGYAGAAYHVDKAGTFSLFATRIDYGTFRETDESGFTVGEFTAGEYGINAGYSRQIDSNLTVGANLKFIQSNMYLWKASGVAVDVAMNYNIPAKNFSASFLIRNIGMVTRQYNSGNDEKLPFEMEAGFSFKPQHMPFRFSLALQQLQKWDLTYTDPANPPQLVDPISGDSIKVSEFKTFADKLARHCVFGGELLIGKAVSVRLGYNYQRRKELLVDTRRGLTGFSFGFGIRIKKIQLNYARAKYHLAGSTNTFTVTATLSEFYRKK